MTKTTTHLGKVIEQTSGEPNPIARVPSKQATHAPRTKTRDCKMDNQRREPLEVANKATKHTTQPEPPVCTNVKKKHGTTRHKSTIHPGPQTDKKTQVRKSYDTPPGKFKKILVVTKERAKRMHPACAFVADRANAQLHLLLVFNFRFSDLKILALIQKCSNFLDFGNS